MQNLETVLQKIAESPLDTAETALLTPLTKKSHKMAELALDTPDQKKIS